MTRPPLRLALVLHNHQPVGNLPEVFAATYDAAYAPMLDRLERHPAVRFVAHYTGPLLEWLAAERPGFLARLRSAIERGQAEVIGGALQEPILAVIPHADKEGQLRAMSDGLERTLGVRPTGAWLAERVWEPHLPPFLARCGISYTILDEEHFEKAGMGKQGLDGYYVTEDGGHLLAVFPASTELRYLIPWRGVDEVMTYLRREWERGRRLLVFADDGEKFGGWPGTYRHCYEDGWLEHFLGAVEASGDWLQTTALKDYVPAAPATGRVYLPSSSYHEMEDWSLPPLVSRDIVRARDTARGAGHSQWAGFMRLGHWRNFLARYAEANVAQQRATHVSTLVHAMPARSRRDEALAHLWRGQCNCPYWHGVFGGVYMYHVRHATFAEIIAAESVAEDLAPSQMQVTASDFDADGSLEVRLAGKEQSAFVHGSGGCLYEWDLRHLPLNLLNTLAPYTEAYSLPEGATSLPPVRLRRAFQDSLLDALPGADAAVDDRWPGGVWLGEARHVLTYGTAESTAWAAAEAAPVVWGGALVGLRKRYHLAAGEQRLSVSYGLEASEVPRSPLVLAVELSLAMPPGSHQFGRADAVGQSHGLMDVWQAEGARAVALSTTVNRRLSVNVQWDRPARVLGAPLLSRHRSEQGEERVYQGSRLILAWPLDLTHGAWQAAIELSWSE